MINLYIYYENSNSLTNIINNASKIINTTTKGVALVEKLNKISKLAKRKYLKKEKIK